MYFNLRLWAMTAGFRIGIFLAALLGLLAIGAGIARLAITGIAIARVFQGDELSSLYPELGAIAILVVLRGALQYARDMLSDSTASRIKIGLRQQLYEHAVALGPGHFDQRRTGDVLMTLVDGVEALEAFFGKYLPQFFVAAIAPVLIFGYMAFLDISIGLIFLVFAIFTFLAPSLLHRATRHLSIMRRDAYGTMGADFLDSVQGLATLKAFGQSKVRGQFLAERAKGVYKTTMRVFMVDGSSGGLTLLGISGGAALALVWGSTQVSDGELELRTLLIVLMLGAEVFRPLRELTQLYHQGMLAMASAEGVLSLLGTPAGVEDPLDSGESQKLRPEISFDNVSLAYEGGRRPALEGVSFTLNAGERLGVVGSSGAGKTTLVWLILRFLDPQQGSILLGGQDIRDLPLQKLREQIAVVTQDTYLFHGTVAENLRFGNAEGTQQELEEAARIANAHDFISRLPDGYETVIGERGIRLSGGQRQRIAIARAVLKAAPILVLDEALSNVDSESESLIQEALDRLMVGKTTLVIAHRLSSVVNSDRILVLNDGHLVETGTHTELVAANGTYASLMLNQQAVADDDFFVSTLATEVVEESAVHQPDIILPSQAHDLDAALPAQEPLSTLTVWKRLLALVAPWKMKLSLSLMSGLLFHGSTVGLGATSAVLVGRIFTGDYTGLLMLLLGVFVVLVGLGRWLEGWLSHDFAYQLLADMRIDMYNRLEPLAPAYLVKRRSGDLTSVVGGDVETVEYFYAHGVTPSIVAVLVPAVVLIALLFLAWPLALVLSPFVAIAAVSPFFSQKYSERLGVEMRERLGDLNAFMVDNIQGMREIVAFGQGKSRVEQTSRKGNEFSDHRTPFLRVQAFQASFIESVTALGGLAIVAAGAWLVSDGQLDKASLPLATLLALAAFAPVTELATTLRQLMETLAACRRIFAIHDEPVAVQDGPGVALSRDGAPVVSYENVEFAYGPNLPQALRGVNFEMGAGQTIALVGRSGAGKTTTAQLLLRFWDPDSGGIDLDEHDLRSFELDGLRSQVALVSQDTYLFNTTIRENFRISKQDASDAEIEEAARLANVHEFIDSIPDRYDTAVGERGMQLSGGQRQRIAIARAMLKDAPVLILDEATSHLDAVNEQQIREALGRLQQGRTTLVIAHRLSTVRDADHIVVMDEGRVAEQGTHQELLSLGGLYAQLVSTQMVSAASSDGVR
jgi:ATP-binding cassette subfamily B protein